MIIWRWDKVTQQCCLIYIYKIMICPLLILVRNDLSCFRSLKHLKCFLEVHVQALRLKVNE